VFWIGPEKVRFVYAFASGTSMATPLTAGIAALVRTRFPELGPDQVMDRIKYTAEDVNAATYPGKDAYLGFGRVNAYRALTVAAHPVVSYRSRSIDDAGGNANGRADPGETVRMTVTLGDAWTDAAGVSATLASADPCVTVTVGSASFGSMAAGALATSATPFELRVSPACAQGKKVSLSLAVAGAGVSQTLSVPLTLGYPPILLVSDDGNAGFRLYYTDALDALGWAYDVWDVPFDADGPPASELARYRAVIWDAKTAAVSAGGVTFLGRALTTADVAALEAYLDGGGALLLAAGDVTDNTFWTAELGDFITRYLHASATTPMAASAVAGTVGGTFAGIQLEAGGDLTYLDPDALATSLFADGDPSSAWYGRSVAVRYPASGAAAYRAIYLGFDVHRLASPDGRRFVLQRSLETLLGQALSAKPDLAPLCRTGGYLYRDEDANGTERVALDASETVDPEQAAISYAWKEGTASLARGVTATVRLGLGPHYLTLTCTDAGGASRTKAVVAQVDPPLAKNYGPSIPAPPAGPAAGITGVPAAFTVRPIRRAAGSTARARTIGSGWAACRSWAGPTSRARTTSPPTRRSRSRREARRALLLRLSAPVRRARVRLAELGRLLARLPLAQDALHHVLRRGSAAPLPLLVRRRAAGRSDLLLPGARGVPRITLGAAPLGLLALPALAPLPLVARIHAWERAHALARRPRAARPRASRRASRRTSLRYARRMMTFSARCFAASPNVSYAFITSSRRNSCVMSFRGASRPETTFRRSIGVVTVSTSRVVIVTLCDQSFSSLSDTGLPCTPTFATCPPAVTMSWQTSKVAGIPTASIATSTPFRPVSAITRSTALPSELFTTCVAPNCLATSSRFASRSTMMSSDGE
jgi:hypothetical protein